ncbi:MAG: hypothetical protein NC311_14665, partial [Muribaculaceae bacterium]|nr:hypothetical protein [Muribaculaceae bacterium]
GRGRHTHNTFLPPTEETTTYIISPWLHLSIAYGCIIKRPVGQRGYIAPGASADSTPTPRCEATKSISVQPTAQGDGGPADCDQCSRLALVHKLPVGSTSYADTLVRSLHRYRLFHLFASSAPAPAQPTQRSAHLD